MSERFNVVPTQIQIEQIFVFFRWIDLSQEILVKVQSIQIPWYNIQIKLKLGGTC